MLRSPTKPQADSTHQRTLPSAVWTDDHVEIRTGKELGAFVGDEIGELDANDSSWLKLAGTGITVLLNVIVVIVIPVISTLSGCTYAR
jgi:hypothetical protein